MSDLVANYIAKCKTAVASEAACCTVCGGVLAHVHDHQPDNTGLDDGPWLPGQAPRKKAARKQASEYAAIRASAWATRRAKYGERGHR